MRMQRLAYGVLLLTGVVGSGCSLRHSPSATSRLVDPRDGQAYPVIGFAERRWMGRNLNYPTPSSWCYDDAAALCVEEGRLYAWDAARDACPHGWRLPNDADWLALITAFGGYYVLAERRSVGDPTQSYESLLEGGSSGFAARLSGGRDTAATGRSADRGADGMYWSESNKGRDSVSLFVFNRKYERVLRDQWKTDFAASVRCIES